MGPHPQQLCKQIFFLFWRFEFNNPILAHGVSTPMLVDNLVVKKPAGYATPSNTAVHHFRA
jgi:hypothetical protein